MQVGSINLNKESKNIQWNDCSQWSWRNWTDTCSRVKLDHWFTLHTKLTQKWITNVNLRLKVIKLLGGNTGGGLLDIGLSNDVLNLTLAKRIKAKINKWDYIKLKSFCTVRNHQQNENAAY